VQIAITGTETLRLLKPSDSITRLIAGCFRFVSFVVAGSGRNFTGSQLAAREQPPLFVPELRFEVAVDGISDVALGTQYGTALG